MAVSTGATIPEYTRRGGKREGNKWTKCRCGVGGLHVSLRFCASNGGMREWLFWLVNEGFTGNGATQIFAGNGLKRA